MSEHDHADPSFGRAARVGFGLRRHTIGTAPSTPPAWDDDPRDSPAGEAAWIARRLRERDERAVAAQDRELAAWCERHTQERSA